MGAILLLEDGRRFEGEAFGATATRVGEVVFNTAMTGYQEVLTDPSYAEQIVVMTSAHVGNTGVNRDDPESERVHVSGFLSRSFSRAPSSWRSEGGLHRYLIEAGVPGMHHIDTRALVRHIRSRGAMKGVVSTDGTPEAELKKRLDAWPGMSGRALAAEVGTRKSYVFADPEQPTLRVSVVDGGCKRNILRLLESRGCKVTVHPVDAPTEVWLDGADAVFVSNGPGDPAALSGPIEELKKVVGEVPTLGMCLGHQLLGLALGATTYKLKFGHRGANHPVRDEATGKVEITSQNHGFAVDRESLLATGARVSHVNLNDHTVSGFVHDERHVFAVQYHPEACPGPHDSHYLIDEFVAFAKEGRG